MKTSNIRKVRKFVFGSPEDSHRCPLCKRGEIVIGEGEDIYGNEFNYSWECSRCDFYASISATVEKYQRSDGDKWVDIADDEDIDAEYILSTDSEHYLDIDNSLNQLCYCSSGYREALVRAVLTDVKYEDNKE